MEAGSRVTPPPPAAGLSWQTEARRTLAAYARAGTPAQQLAALDALDALARHHPLVLAPLATDLEQGDPAVRARLLGLLAAAGTMEAVPVARWALLDADPTLAAAAAAGALAELAPAGVRNDLVAAWQQARPPAPATREALVAALARAVPAPALAALSRAEPPAMRAAALEALRRQGAPEAAALDAPESPLLRAEARAWLFRHHGANAVPWLLQSLAGVGSRLEGNALLEAVVLPADPATRRQQPAPADGGCRPTGTLLTLRELRDLLTFLRTLP